MAARYIRLGLWLARWPSQRFALRLAGWTASLLRLSNSEVYRVTRTNLRICFPELSAPALHELCQQSLTQMTMLFFEFAQLTYWPEEKLLAQIESVEGKSLLDQAYASGKGVLLLVPHFGNWELLCAFLGAHYNFAALYDPPKIASFERVMVNTRQRFHGEMFAIDTAGMRKLLRVLKRGQLVAILPDQVPELNAGIYADFFGQPTLTMTLPHRLITKNRPEVLVGSVQRVQNEEGLGYQIRIEPLVGELSDSDPEACATVMNEGIEKVVLRAPAQYQWEYKRFKPPRHSGEKNIYRRQ